MFFLIIVRVMPYIVILNLSLYYVWFITRNYKSHNRPVPPDRGH